MFYHLHLKTKEDCSCVCICCFSFSYRVCFILNPKREQAVEREGGRARVLMCGGILQLARKLNSTRNTCV